MLTRKTPEYLPTNLKVRAQGVEHDIKVTYHNKHPDDVEKWLEEEKRSLEQQVLHITKEADIEFPLTEEGMTEMEKTWPGMLMAFVEGFFKARRAELVKN